MPGAKNKTVIIIVGPTASGKTAVAIDLAKRFQTEIISADSRQCYKELSIGVARPSQYELQEVHHNFIATHSIFDPVSAGMFEEWALAKINELFQVHDVVVMAGGTGLYIRAFTEGMDAMPLVPGEIRTEIKSSFEKKGLAWLQKEVSEQDPEFFKVAETENPQRLMRALEMVRATGKSITEFRRRQTKERGFHILKLGLRLSKEDLHRRIDQRVEEMIVSGLVEEVRGLLPYRNLNALQTVGYSEIFEFLDGRISLTEAASLIKKNTKQYAKRQMTWFKKDVEIKWLDAHGPIPMSLFESFLA